VQLFTMTNPIFSFACVSLVSYVYNNKLNSEQKWRDMRDTAIIKVNRIQFIEKSNSLNQI
jgi:hypothetical protein